MNEDHADSFAVSNWTHNLSRSEAETAHAPKFPRSMLICSASVLSMFGAAAPVHAQSTGGPDYAIEELIVTAQKRAESVQDVPIAVSAFDQSALEKAKIDGGPNLVLAVPNVNFSKANFSTYNFQIRGIGSKLLAASADAGTGIHLNNAPLIANNLFETEFYDVERLEVLRGPQGTLYGRNATGGVVNLISVKPKDAFEANFRGEYGNYNAFKARGMINVPLGDTFALRVAGSYLARDGFGTNTTTGNDIDDRDLYGIRATLSFRPTERFRAWAMWDHFEEHDTRSRSGKQYCTKDSGRNGVGGVSLSADAGRALVQRGFFSQGCSPTSLFSSASLGTVNSQATSNGLVAALSGMQTGDAYAGKIQVPNVRDIESTFDPSYKAKTDIYEVNAAFAVSDNVTLNWLTAYTVSKYISRQDYNRYAPSSSFNTVPNSVNLFAGNPGYPGIYAALFPGGVVKDPQNGAFNHNAASDISTNYGTQWSHEIRLESDYAGPLNYNIGAILSRYQAYGDIFVMWSATTAYYQIQNQLSTGNSNCTSGSSCIAIDPNRDPTRQGHNYFDSYGPYDLTSYAAFGEVYWRMTESLKWTLGLRYTVDDKQIENHALALGVPGSGVLGPRPGQAAVSKVKFKEPTGRFGFDWQPDVAITESTLIYAFYSRGYKAGGLNSPVTAGIGVVPTPATFDPEFINAYEIGTKNTLLGGTLQVNLTGFYYDYKGYQVSKTINRSSVTENIDAEVMGAEFESIWQPLRGLRLNAAIGYLDTQIKDASSIDIFNRSQGNPGLTFLKSSTASGCVVSTPDAARALEISNSTSNPFALLSVCTLSSAVGAGSNIGGTGAIAAGTNGFGSLVSEGVVENLDGNSLPNTPHWTVSLGAQYTWIWGDWDATLRGDYYRQTKTYARIYNSEADRLKAWDNVNLTFTLTNSDRGLDIGAFVKNAANDNVITDFYLADDSSGLYRNAFYNEPRTYGVSITKRW